MRITLHIGVEHCGAGRAQTILANRRDLLARHGIRYAASPGNKNHTRLWMAATDPDHIDPLRHHRGFGPADKQAALREAVMAELREECDAHKPEHLILSAAQLCWLAEPSELERLRDMLAPLSDDIRIVAFVDEQAALMTRIYADQVMEGRTAPLSRELAMAQNPNWWHAARTTRPEPAPEAHQFTEIGGAPFWLDYARLIAHWDAVFGTGHTRLVRHDGEAFAAPDITRLIAEAFDIPADLGIAKEASAETPLPAPALTRARRMNELLVKLVSKSGKHIPRQMWRGFLDDLKVDGPPLDPAHLAPLSKHFTKSNTALSKAHPLLGKLTKPRAKKDWQEEDPLFGFRASQYLLSFMWQIDKANRGTSSPAGPPPADELSETAQNILPPLAVKNFHKLKSSSFAPHNRIGAVDEEQLAAPFTPLTDHAPRPGSTGNVIVGCMKNEAPYIVEWIAYHRAIGVHNFLIYTNGCEDGTSEILDRLQDLGIVQHRNNDNWKGNSPQQHALNKALKEPVIRNADWVVHIDVDEFMNIRCGNGTLPDLFERVPDATNIAMTWRLFGHNGVTDLADDFVIDQFDTCAPKFCPKPHTVWGFKTMTRNTGAYAKLSCHRPNKLDEAQAGAVKWVNGSGQDMTAEAAKNGWRNSKKSIGYDLIQLNHYALRSAESFLIKRQRGRALHVDRSIGLNYWIRMDWSDYRDVTIKRNLPRLRAEYDRLMQDSRLRALHKAGLNWHRAKADELHGMPEFQELYDGALKIKLTGMERVAYALALDMES